MTNATQQDWLNSDDWQRQMERVRAQQTPDFTTQQSTDEQDKPDPLFDFRPKKK